MALQQLFAQGYFQTDMFSAFDWKSIDCIVVDHLGDATERAAKLTQYVVPTWSQLNSHVHKSVTAPAKTIDK